MFRLNGGHQAVGYAVLSHGHGSFLTVIGVLALVKHPCLTARCA